MATVLKTITGEYELSQLKEEINTAPDIVPSCTEISGLNQNLTLTFTNDLSVLENTKVDQVIAAHVPNPFEDAHVPDIEKRTPDGRLRVRSDSLPLGMTTSFTSQGDGTTIGNGKKIFWDFANNDDIVAAPSGYKRKAILLSFVDSIYLKEGAAYFFDAVKGSYLDVMAICPAGAYYRDRQGNPAYANTPVELSRFIRHHFFTGSCPMGDEFNTEVAQDNALPSGYQLCFQITVPDTDNISYGSASIELYRKRTVLLPGETI